MAHVACRNCGAVTDLTSTERDAESFCPQCDYPLFWSGDAGESPAGSGYAGLRLRLPGVVGRSSAAAIDCPACSEQNPVSGEFCHRCGAPLRAVAGEVEEVAVERPPPLERLEPVLIRAGSRWLQAGLGFILAGLAVLVLMLAVGISLAVDVAAPLFGGASSAADAAADRGLLEAVGAWSGPMTLLGLGMIVAGAAMWCYALVPNIRVTAEAAQEALPVIAEDLKG